MTLRWMPRFNDKDLNAISTYLTYYLDICLQVRQIEFKDPVEEEWNKFQKEIGDEVTASVAIQEEDQEESTAERQLEEIEEQMIKWGRVLELEQKKELYGQRVRAIRESMVEEKDTSSSDDDDAEMDKFFDWRSKAT